MNGYEINILFNAEQDAKDILRNYESQIGPEEDYLETVLSKLFKLDFDIENREYNIDSLKHETNEIQIYCYGSKYPKVVISDLFNKLKFSEVLGIRARTKFDDGGKENSCFINSQECSVQKYNAFYRKNKVEAPSKKKKKVVKKIKRDKTEQKTVPKVNKNKDKQDELLKLLDYGKQRACKTAIIRVLIRGKVKRQLVRNIFEKHIKLNSVSKKKGISKVLNIFSKSKNTQEFWPEYDEEHEKLNFKAPEELMGGLIFVVEQDNYLYFGFDIEYSSIPSGGGLDKYLKNLVLSFDAIEGVNKTWIKFRPGSNTIKERYIYYPDAGRNPQTVVINLTEDFQWPN